ncbi:MAG TPA: tetratricopeptide repeat protein [Acidobacteriaceae bacterium]|nr:tetratricopeptide repeat protein [Acidobacteriaceae bacterium]
MKTASTTTSSKRPRTIAGSASSSPDTARAQNLALYESALRLMQEGKFDKAHTAFNQMLASSPGDLAERARVYINACLQQIQKQKTNFGSDEERYDYAVSLINDGNYEDARTELNQILRSNKNADYAFYGLAVLASVTSDAQACLEHLTEAIRLNPRNRIQARSDSDFQEMAEDPRFTELLYPEM